MATFGAETNRQKKHLRKAHETIMNAGGVEDGFTPLNVPERPLIAHLPVGANLDDPASFFRMFFGEEQFEGFVDCTNKYARNWESENPESNRPTFRPVSIQEIKVYVALLIFLGYQGNGRPKDHWDAPSQGSPVHRMKWKRYEAIKRYFKVSDFEEDEDLIPEDWHHKMSPLDTHLQAEFQAVVTLGSHISYDEMMIGYRGRSQHITKVPGKPEPNGYKIWALCHKGYIYDWLYYSGSCGESLISYFWCCC